MDLALKAEDVAFRTRVRQFLAGKADALDAARAIRDKGRDAVASGADILRETGWLASHWPVEWGGAGLAPVERYILEEELCAARFPPRDRIALDLAGPVIVHFGTPAQKKRYLPEIVAGREIWCQGFSEPESGSDVNSVRTSATREGADFIVDGHKIWTTNAHFADWMFALVRIRADGKLQRGLTMLVIDMRAPGVSIRPIETIDRRHHFNEVRLDNVRVPLSNILGEAGLGWQNARFLLANERVLLAQAPMTRQKLERVKRRLRGGEYADLDAQSFGRRLTEFEVELMALEFGVLRVLHAQQRDNLIDGLTSALKIRGAALRQRISELEAEMEGHRVLVMDTDLSIAPQAADAAQAAEAPRRVDDFLLQDFLFDLSGSIAGGTSEIQKNLIAGITLGL